MNPPPVGPGGLTPAEVHARDIAKVETQYSTRQKYDFL